MPEQISIDDLIGGDATGLAAKYQAFTDKFKPKKTTDDCYTLDNIYQAVAGWVAKEYGVDEGAFVRPFWPGGDTNEENEARWRCTHCGKIVKREPSDKRYCSSCGCEMRREA